MNWLETHAERVLGWMEGSMAGAVVALALQCIWTHIRKEKDMTPEAKAELMKMLTDVPNGTPPMPAAGPEIKPGVNTSEYQVAQSSGTWAKFLMVVGSVLAVAGPVLDGILQTIQRIPDYQQNHTLALICAAIGGVITVTGAIKKALADTAYISGRSLVKAAAARDAAPPAQV